jgi:hypothetical protein
MILGVSAKAPKKGNWVSLTSGLTWLAFEHGFETKDLIDWLGKRQWPTQDALCELLTNEWQELAEEACGGSVSVRGRKGEFAKEVELSVDDYRNFQFVWLQTAGDPQLHLNRFDSSFGSTFRAITANLNDRFENPVIRRADLVRFKQARAQRKRRPWNDAAYKAAMAWLPEKLATLSDDTGIKSDLVAEMRDRFGLPLREAERVFTEVTKALKRRTHGRPRKTSPEKLAKPGIADEFSSAPAATNLQTAATEGGN